MSFGKFVKVFPVEIAGQQRARLGPMRLVGSRPEAQPQKIIFLFVDDRDQNC